MKSRLGEKVSTSHQGCVERRRQEVGPEIENPSSRPVGGTQLPVPLFVAETSKDATGCPVQRFLGGDR